VSTPPKSAASPEPTHSVPSAGSERTVPIEWLAPSEGMQSTVLAAAGQGWAVLVPSSTVSADAVLLSATVIRVSREDFGPL
jgi:hypothetical protein